MILVLQDVTSARQPNVRQGMSIFKKRIILTKKYMNVAIKCRIGSLDSGDDDKKLEQIYGEHKSREYRKYYFLVTTTKELCTSPFHS